MRILMLTQYYPPFIGGEERFVCSLSTSLAVRGHQVSVATLGSEGLAAQEVDQGVTIYRLRGTAQRTALLFSDSHRRHVPPLPDPEMTLALRRVIQSERPEIVHAHNWLVHSFLPLKRRRSAKLVLSLHDYSLMCATKKLIRCDRLDAICSGPGLRKCLHCAAHHYGVAKGTPTVLATWMMAAIERRAVDMYLPVSQATADNLGLRDAGVAFEVVPNFLPDGGRAEDYSAYIAQLPSDGYLMYAGADGEYKGISVLLDAYAGLTNAPPLVLLGYPTAEHTRLPVQLPPNVVTLSAWPHGAVLEAWRRCLFAVVPSRWGETFGLVALEAMAAGRPVIASRIGGLSEVVVDEETGLLVPPGDIDALRAAMQRLLADPTLRKRMGCAAFERAQLFTAEAIVPRFEAIYRSLSTSAPL